jgi:tetratricopeptide (TPR) repeat protein
MSVRLIIAVGLFVLVGLGALALMFTSGRGQMVYVPDEAVKHRERGEFLLSRRLHTTDKTQKAELLTQAIEQFKLAIESKPDFDVAYNMLGQCYLERGQWDAALHNLNKALELRQDYPAALYNRGRVYRQLSMGSRDPTLIDKAIADYQAALSSELSVAFVGDLHKALAEAYHQKGDLPSAIEQLKLYLEKAPHAQDAALVERKIRGLLLMHQGDAPMEGEVQPQPAPAP